MKTRIILTYAHIAGLPKSTDWCYLYRMDGAEMKSWTIPLERVPSLRENLLRKGAEESSDTLSTATFTFTTLTVA